MDMAVDWTHAVMTFGLRLASWREAHLSCELAVPCYCILPVLQPNGVMILELNLLSSLPAIINPTI